MIKLLDFCMAGEDIWQSLVPLIHFHIIHWHHLDKVMCQFGVDKPIPTRPHQLEHLHLITLAWRNCEYWQHVNKDYIAI